MSWGYNPFITEKSPYHGAYLAVVESVSKLIAAGAEFKDVYLTFQEYFENLRVQVMMLCYFVPGMMKTVCLIANRTSIFFPL